MTEQKQPQYFYVGQTVYHYQFGEGKVSNINDKGKYPIRVDFSEGWYTFTNEGKFEEYDIKPTLSQKPIPEIQNEPLPEMPDLKEGDVVVCWDNDKESAIIAVFKSFSPGNKHPYTVDFIPGSTGKRWQVYKNCEKYDPEKHYKNETID